MKKAVVWLGLVALLVVCVVFYRGYLVRELRMPILASLSDPDSAKFRHEVLISPWLANNSVLCGEVNSKNKMGGYSGYRAFAAGIDESQNEGAEIIDYDSISEAVCAAVIERGSKWWWIRW